MSEEKSDCEEEIAKSQKGSATLAILMGLSGFLLGAFSMRLYDDAVFGQKNPEPRGPHEKGILLGVSKSGALRPLSKEEKKRVLRLVERFETLSPSDRKRSVRAFVDELIESGIYVARGKGIYLEEQISKHPAQIRSIVTSAMEPS